MTLIITAALRPLSNCTPLMATDLPRHWWRIDYGALWSLSLATHQPAPPPIACDGGEGVHFVGAERAIFALRSDNGEVVTSIEDLTDVRSIQRIHHGPVLVSAGDQLVAFRPSGALLWRQVLPDLVDELQVHQDQLRVTDVSGETYALSVSTGLPVGPSTASG